jgi:chromosome segregation ATPase
MSDPVNPPTTREEFHTAEVMRLTEKLDSLQKKYAKLDAAHDDLGMEGMGNRDTYNGLSSTPELQKKNQDELTRIEKKLEGIQSKMEGVYEELETCYHEIKETKQALSELSLKPDESFRLENEKDLGIDFEALNNTAEAAERELKVTTKKFQQQWDGWETPEAMLDGQVKGQNRELQHWKDLKTKNEGLKQGLQERRDKLGSNVFKRVLNWKEISKIDSKVKDIPNWQKSLDRAMKNTEEDIVKAERARDRYNENVAKLNQQKAEDSLAQAQKSEVALKSEDDLGVDFKALSKVGKESEGQLSQMKSESELNRLTGELERLKKGQGTMENAFNHVDDTWEDLKNQRKQLSGDPISRFRNKEQLKEIDKELEIVMPQWYALQDGKLKYQAEIAKTEQAISVCEKQIELAKQAPELQQKPLHQSVGETTHLSHGTHGAHVPQESQKPQLAGLAGEKAEHPSVGQKTHMGLHGHGDKNGQEVGVSKNPFRQGQKAPQ